MKELTLNKKIILFLLLNKDSRYSGSYELIKILAWWFDIIEYNEILKELIEDGLVRRNNNQIGIYFITQDGTSVFNQSRAENLLQIKLAYPDQLKQIEFLERELMP